MEDKNFGIYKRNVAGSTIYFCHYYDEYGKRYSRSTGCKTKAAANAWIVEQLEKGTLFGKNPKDITMKEFAEPFWIYETCPIVQSKILRGGSITKGYCRTSRQLMEEKIVKPFGNLLCNDIARTG